MPDRFESFFAERIGSDGADQQRVVAEPAGMRREVQRRPAESSRVLEEIPQHFAQDDDRTPARSQPVNTDCRFLSAASALPNKYLASGKRMSIVFAGAAGIANHQIEVEQNIACRQARLPQPLQHGADGNRTHRRARLMDRGKGNRKQAGVFDVVDAGHADFRRYAHAEVS